LSLLQDVKEAFQSGAVEPRRYREATTSRKNQDEGVVGLQLILGDRLDDHGQKSERCRGEWQTFRSPIVVVKKAV